MQRQLINGAKTKIYRKARKESFKTCEPRQRLPIAIALYLITIFRNMIDHRITNICYMPGALLPPPTGRLHLFQWVLISLLHFSPVEIWSTIAFWCDISYCNVGCSPVKISEIHLNKCILNGICCKFPLMENHPILCFNLLRTWLILLKMVARWVIICDLCVHSFKGLDKMPFLTKSVNFWFYLY